MPSPSNVSELVLFVGGAVLFTALALVASRYTKFGRKMTGDWRPGPVQISPIARPREKYDDPLKDLKPQTVILGSIVLLLVLFAYYFITKNTFQAGN